MASPITIPSATAVKTVVVNGGNLFRIALDNLGDPLQWNRIAAANRILDPFLLINSPTTLVIPAVNPALSELGGILQPNFGTPIFAPGPPSQAQIPPEDVPEELSIPVNITPPTISGVLSIGQLLTAVVGEWTNEPTAFLFQWYRNAVLVSVGSTYVLTGDDEGATFQVSVIAVSAAGQSLPAISSATSVIGSNLTYDFSDPAQSGILCWLKAS